MLALVYCQHSAKQMEPSAISQCQPQLFSNDTMGSVQEKRTFTKTVYSKYASTCCRSTAGLTRSQVSGSRTASATRAASTAAPSSSPPTQPANRPSIQLRHTHIFSLACSGAVHTAHSSGSSSASATCCRGVLVVGGAVHSNPCSLPAVLVMVATAEGIACCSPTTKPSASWLMERLGADGRGGGGNGRQSRLASRAASLAEMLCMGCRHVRLGSLGEPWYEGHGTAAMVSTHTSRHDPYTYVAA